MGKQGRLTKRKVKNMQGKKGKWDSRLKRMKVVRSLLYLHKSSKVALADLTEGDIDEIISGLDSEIQKAETRKLKVVRIEKL